MTGRTIRGAIVLLLAGATVALPSLARGATVRRQPPAGSTQTTVPDRVTITFTEAQARPASLEVVDPCGARADRGSASVSGTRVSVAITGTASGRYAVTYEGVAAVDGSQSRESFSFRVRGLEGCAEDDVPRAGRAGRGIWDLPKGDFAVALAIAAVIGALGGLVYAAILGPKA